MKKFRLLSAFLSVVMAIGMSPAALTVGAASTETPTPGYDYTKSETNINYYTQSFDTPEAKLATMKRVLPKENEISYHGMELYVEECSGEVALKNTKTGQIVFSNPYNISKVGATDDVKDELLSQIIIKYTENGNEVPFYSFKEACLRGQITVKETKTGVRVEYVIGREETRKLVPKHIEKERFETQILAKITDPNHLKKLKSFYEEQFPEDAKQESPRKLADMNAAYPITKTGMAIYVFDDGAKERELELIESYIKRYCPEYTFDELEKDHELTEYEGQDKAPVLFRVALEYTFDEDGNLDVRLPANAIRYDESVYQINSISVLPWFGAGVNTYEGYTMFPDGSGTLVRFEEAGADKITITDKVYGPDYAYQKIEGENRETVRLPVFGIYESDVEAKDTNFNQIGDDGEAVSCRLSAGSGAHYETGLLAIIEEGESLATITSQHGGSQYPYHTAFATFTPRPQDSYQLDEAIAGSADAAQYSVVSERKYAGSFRIKYIMLTGTDEMGKHGDRHYEAGYVGMAKAYRDYLIKNGVLTEKTDNSSDIPLYIESFGSIQTTEKILSMPVEVLKPLTTFDDLKTMYDMLSEKGITNVNFKLTGFTNGGLNSTSPYHVDFDKEVGGNDGFTDFVNNYASGKTIGVFPDFDFANVSQFSSFDGVSNKEHLIKTMDGRYTTKRYYDSTLQSFQRGYSLAISPSVYEYFFNSFATEYSELNPYGVSASTLGTDLNSDFDKDDPYNREDSKQFTTEMLSNLNAAFNNVMVDGGNAYSLAYADHIINVPLDSSRYSNANEAIPFIGMVLHGCVDFAGTPINMAGDMMYELLKAIENGSSIYFTLSSQNTSLLKEDERFNKYYSVDFKIWFEDSVEENENAEDSENKTVTEAPVENTYDTVVELYTVLNAELKELQNQQIVGHEFIPGYREGYEAAEEDEPEENVDKGLLGQNVETWNPYLSDEGRIVKVTYEGGKTFILNYNNFAVDVEVDGATYTVKPINYVVVK